MQKKIKPILYVKFDFFVMGFFSEMGDIATNIYGRSFDSLTRTLSRGEREQKKRKIELE